MSSALANHFGFSEETSIRSFGLNRVVVLIRRELLDRRKILKEGVLIKINEWKMVVNILWDGWFSRRERWFTVVGFPFHLWDEENNLKLGGCAGEPLEVDVNSIDLVKFDMLELRWTGGKCALSVNLFFVLDGLKEYRVMMFLAVSADDLNMVLDFPDSGSKEMVCNTENLENLNMGPVAGV